MTIRFQVGDQKWPAHLFILASRADYFRKHIPGLATESDPSAEKPVIEVTDVEPDVMEQLLKFIYTDTCDLLTIGSKVTFAHLDKRGNGMGHRKDESHTITFDGRAVSAFEVVQRGKKGKGGKEERSEVKAGSRGKDVVKVLQEAARKFGVKGLSKRWVPVSCLLCYCSFFSLSLSLALLFPSFFLIYFSFLLFFFFFCLSVSFQSVSLSLSLFTSLISHSLSPSLSLPLSFPTLSLPLSLYLSHFPLSLSLSLFTSLISHSLSPSLSLPLSFPTLSLPLSLTVVFVLDFSVAFPLSLSLSCSLFLFVSLPVSVLFSISLCLSPCLCLVLYFSLSLSLSLSCSLFLIVSLPVSVLFSISHCLSPCLCLVLYFSLSLSLSLSCSLFLFVSLPVSVSLIPSLFVSVHLLSVCVLSRTALWKSQVMLKSSSLHYKVSSPFSLPESHQSPKQETKSITKMNAHLKKKEKSIIICTGQNNASPAWTGWNHLNTISVFEPDKTAKLCCSLEVMKHLKWLPLCTSVLKEKRIKFVCFVTRTKSYFSFYRHFSAFSHFLFIVNVLLFQFIVSELLFCM